MFRILRMARVFRIFKLGKHNSMMTIIIEGASQEREGEGGR